MTDYLVTAKDNNDQNLFAIAIFYQTFKCGDENLFIIEQQNNLFSMNHSCSSSKCK